MKRWFNLLVIDTEYFLDDDGQAYLYWGSGHGWVNGKCWLVKLKPDLSSFDGAVKDVTPANYFEGPLLVKRHGLYFLMYSSGKTIEENYQVHYAVGKSPYGPFTEGSGSPVLVTDKNLNVISPGHHTIFQRDGHDLILYHRHSIPFDPKFIGRQICVDPIAFTADGRIEQVKPTHQGPTLVQGRAEAQTRVTSGAVFTASSEAGEFTRAACAFDDNYATRWAAAPEAQGAWLQVDFGGVQTITRQLIRPEYAWNPHRFAVEASSDGKVVWQRVEDHTRAAVTGSPLVIGKAFSARFVRLVFSDSLKGSDISLLEWSLF